MAAPPSRTLSLGWTGPPGTSAAGPSVADDGVEGIAFMHFGVHNLGELSLLALLS